MGTGQSRLQFSGSWITGEDVCPTVLSAEYRPFGEGGQPRQGRWPVGTHDGIGQNPVVKGDINAIVVPVEGHGLHIHVGVEQLGRPDPDASGLFQGLLRAGG